MTTRAAPKVRSFAERYERMKDASVYVLKQNDNSTVYRIIAPKGRSHDIEVLGDAPAFIVGACDCDAYQYLRDPEGCVHVQKIRDFLQENNKMTNTTELTTTEYVGDIVPAAPLGLGSALMMRDVLTPRNVNEALELAKLFHQSGMFGVSNPGQAFVILSLGMELGLSVSQAFRSIHVIKNKPTLSADILVALCKQSPACIYFKLVESNDQRAVYETQRRGEDPTPMTFTIKDAQKAGLIMGGGNWDKYPAAMCRARASSALARAVYPDVVAGLYTPDEAEAINVTPSQPAQRPVNRVSEAVEDVDNGEARELYRSLSKANTAALKAMAPDVRAEWQSWMSAKFGGKAYKDLSIEQLAELKGAIDAATEAAQSFQAPETPLTSEEAAQSAESAVIDPQDDPFADS